VLRIYRSTLRLGFTEGCAMNREDALIPWFNSFWASFTAIAALNSGNLYM